MVKLTYSLVGIAGDAIQVEINGHEAVSALKKVIMAVDPIITCAERDMKLFPAKKDGGWLSDEDPAALQLVEGKIHPDISAAIAGNPMKGSSSVQNALGATTMPPPEVGQIHVLVKVLTSSDSFEQNKRPRFEALEDIPQIQLPENDYMTLPAALVAKCGLKSVSDLMLYCRTQVRDLWQFFRNEVIANNVKAYVVGPPGTGKSACTLCFAASLDRQEWNVVWIHLSRVAPNTCLAMSNKEFWYVENLTTFKLPRVDQKKIFIVLDGVIKKGTHEAFVQRVLTFLGDEDRLVVCSSMATYGKTNRQDEFRAKINIFLVYSWTQDEYFAAISDPEFYATVVDKFDATCISEVNEESGIDETLDEEAKKRHACDLKFYYAGGSCRFMFQDTTEDLKITVEKALDSVADKTDLVKYCCGSLHKKSINTLYGMQLGGPDGGRIPVSSYVTSRFVNECGEQVIAALATRLNVSSNPSMDGYLFEWLFFIAVSKRAVKLFADAEHADILPKANVLRFDPKKRFKRLDKKTVYPGVIFRCHSSDKYDINYENGWKETNVSAECIQLPDDQILKEGVAVKAHPRSKLKGDKSWLQPAAWNQGGYDALYFNVETGNVTFVQLTRSDKHDFKIQYFCEVLLKLRQAGMEIVNVVVYFVVKPTQWMGFRVTNVEGRDLLKEYDASWTHPEENHVKVRAFETLQ